MFNKYALIQRAWINQPSTIQEDHQLHGMNVIVDFSKSKDFPTVYPTEGKIISMIISRLSLSPGWRPN